MDDYDFEKIDREREEQILLDEMADALLEDMMIERSTETIKKAPPRYEWIPIGLCNGIDLPDMQIGGFYDIDNNIQSNLIIEKDYTVWQKIECPEYDCKTILY